MTAPRPLTVAEAREALGAAHARCEESMRDLGHIQAALAHSADAALDALIAAAKREGADEVIAVVQGAAAVARAKAARWAEWPGQTADGHYGAAAALSALAAKVTP